jgi:hypothetical protein
MAVVTIKKMHLHLNLLSHSEIMYRREVKSSTGETPLDNANGDDAQLLSTNKRQKRSSSEKITKQTALELALAKTSRESREAAGQNVGTNGGWGSITAVATKKVNWDLKRDVQHRLDRLEKRTQRAIVELLRERLEREAGEVANDDDGGDDDSDLD